MADSPASKMKNFIIDVDGVMTDGQFHVSSEGKVMKIFGPNDHDALLLLKPLINIVFVTGDKKGLPITKKRIEEEMKFPLHVVSTFERIAWIKKNFDPQTTIYMGDGVFDAMVFKLVGYSIAPANAFFKVKEYADFVTEAKGGDSAVAEACFHIAEKFFQPFNVLDLKLGRGEGEWGNKT